MKILKIFSLACLAYFNVHSPLQAQDEGGGFLPVLVMRDTSVKQSLGLGIHNQEFVYDAEFFSPLEPGYTLLGFQLQPELVFRASPKLMIAGGVYLLKYSGMNGFVTARPTFTFSYRFSPSVTLFMGTLHGSLEHRLPEPMYKYDLSFSDYIEEGIQAVVRTPFLKGDYWIDWRSFIQPGDPHQEELVFGTSSLFRPFGGGHSWDISVPLYSLVFHRGGQIDNSSLPVRTFGNLAGGVRLDRKNPDALVGNYGVELQVFHYFDVSGNPLFGFTSGTAVYPRIYAAVKNWSFTSGFWWADNFFSLTGEPQFASVTEVYAGNDADRNLIRLGLSWHKILEGGMKMIFFTNGYWDAKDASFDYAVGLQMIFNHTFGLLDLK